MRTHCVSHRHTKEAFTLPHTEATVSQPDTDRPQCTSTPAAHTHTDEEYTLCVCVCEQTLLPVLPGMTERERQVMKKLKEVVDKQRDEIRAKDRELTLKNEDIEAVRTPEI